MSREKVTKTKQQGGLGIRDIKLNNEAFLTNQAWRIWTNPNGIWAKFLKQRQFPNTYFLNPTMVLILGKSFLKVALYYQKGLVGQLEMANPQNSGQILGCPMVLFDL